MKRQSLDMMTFLASGFSVTASIRQRPLNRGRRPKGSRSKRTAEQLVNERKANSVKTNLSIG
jgi:hypothetical protein